MKKYSFVLLLGFIIFFIECGNSFSPNKLETGNICTVEFKDIVYCVYSLKSDITDIMYLPRTLICDGGSVYVDLNYGETMYVNFFVLGNFQKVKTDTFFISSDTTIMFKK